MTRDLSVIIPVFNNMSTLDELVTRVGKACKTVCGDAYEIVLVDDGSSDESWSAISSFTNVPVVGVRFSRNFGQHAALKAGFVHARGRFIIMMDADLEDPPELIVEIYEQLRDDEFDICYTRLVADELSPTRWTSRVFQKASHMAGEHAQVQNIGTMRGFNAKVRDAILRYGERRPVYGPLITSLGFRHTSIELRLAKRRGWATSYSIRKRIQLAVDYLIGYTNIAAGFFMLASVLSFIGTLIYAIVIIVQYVIVGNVMPPGFSLLIVVVLLLFSVLFFGIGIIGVYIHRVLDETLDRPLYIVSESFSSSSKEQCHTTREVSDVRCD